MNAKELFLAVMDFDTSARTLDWEFAYWNQVIHKWYDEGSLEEKQGLPDGLGDAAAIAGEGVSFSKRIMAPDRDIHELLNLDKGFEKVEFSDGIFPGFDGVVLEDEGDTEIVIGKHGETLRRKKDGSTVAKIIKPAIETESDWDRLREERFQPNYDARKADDWDDLLVTYKNRDFPLSLSGPPVGFFGVLRFLFGEPQIYYMYYDQPKLIHKVNDYLCNLWIDFYSRILDETDVDCAHFWEDMSGKQGSLISPELFREFMTPYYQRITSFLRSRGVKYLFVDTDGDPNGLIPLFLEAGINGMYPFEVQAGSDIVDIRRRYPDLLMLGGLDKRVLGKTKADIDRELDTKLPFMLKHGGYIPFMDHCIPPDATWENFVYYRNRIKEYLGKT